MAKKAQKRKAAMDKRAEFMAREKQIGLDALAKSRQLQAEESLRISTAVEEINRKHRVALENALLNREMTREDFIRAVMIFGDSQIS